MSKPNRGASLSELVAVMDRLLAPDGCPWDREQTLDTLAPYLLEESYELLEALDSGDIDHHREELGDVLLQIVFQAALRERERSFDIDDVVHGIVSKLVHRHPHVFGDAQASDAQEVLEQWEALKEKEKPQRDSVLSGVPATLPALARSTKLSQRAARVGFDWPDVAGCRRKVDEELDELEAAIESGVHDDIEGEVGDLLFAIVSLARKLDVDPEQALRRSAKKFEDRFRFIEAELEKRGKSPSTSNLEEMDALWNESKRL